MINTKKLVKYTEMSDEAFMEKWLAIIGKDVDKNMMKEHVTSYGNHLWHLFMRAYTQRTVGYSVL